MNTENRNAGHSWHGETIARTAERTRRASSNVSDRRHGTFEKYSGKRPRATFPLELIRRVITRVLARNIGKSREFFVAKRFFPRPWRTNGANTHIMSARTRVDYTDGSRRTFLGTRVIEYSTNGYRPRIFTTRNRRADRAVKLQIVRYRPNYGRRASADFRGGETKRSVDRGTERQGRAG